jgi:hypothetical protein
VVRTESAPRALTAAHEDLALGLAQDDADDAPASAIASPVRNRSATPRPRSLSISARTATKVSVEEPAATPSSDS